jgi:predicted HTH transcriptional regulator
MNLDDVLHKYETQGLELKQSLAQRRDGLEALNSMINAEPAHGVVIFGIGPNRNIVGVEPGDLDQAQKSLAQHIHNTFDPPIQPVIELLECESKPLIAVSASRHRGIPYHEYEGRAFIREGSVSRQLTLSEKQHLMRARSRDLHNGPWRCDRCGSYVGMLVSVTLTDHGLVKSYDCECGGEFWPAA